MTAFDIVLVQSAALLHTREADCIRETHAKLLFCGE